jgi:spore germination cell wall hydrolase CwlJ-like protein
MGDTPREVDAWQVAVKSAAMVLKGQVFDFTSGATHYHAVTVAPGWASNLQRTNTIGSHQFYKEF